PAHPRRAHLRREIRLGRGRRHRRWNRRPGTQDQCRHHRPRRQPRADRGRRYRHRDAQGQARLRQGHWRQEGHRILTSAPTIRPAEKADLDTIIDLTWAVAAEGRWIGTETPFDRSERRRRMDEELGYPGRAGYFVAEVDERV